MRLSALPLFLPAVFACQLRRDPVLSTSALYNIDSVRVAVAASRGDSTHWDSYRLAADSASSWTAGAGTLKNILRRAPSSQGYFDLGLVLLNGGQYAEAARALDIARQLGYAPQAEVWCRLAEAYAEAEVRDDSIRTDVQSNADRAIDCVRNAIKLGCVRPERFVREKEYRQVAYTDGFYPAYIAALSTDKRKGLWRAFKAGFTDLPLPLSIDTSWIGNHIDSDGVGLFFYFQPFIPSIGKPLFSRVKTDVFFSVGKVAENPAYTAFIYRDFFLLEDDPLEMDTARTATQKAVRDGATYYLVTYTPSGIPIDKMVVAGHLGLYKPMKMFRMTPSMDFTVSDLVSRFPPGGELPLSSAVENVQHYRIDDAGHIVKAPLGAGATGGM
ncbi:hypothetical protein [Dinghuibacter silviterrae]|uniref:Tetratricopeptide repeat protein n=1 Tax=Dinghuibacter silviterrae TaxID=1539049 RepID=A0A4R8DH42_9BACT|nr:hypothetical protein [Dinghuibacter silviterrae]TDW97013.1 hypothetical protein EDB95_4850 [Dinghuibacter silviterrae]